MGAELGALAISHLEEVTDEGIAAMATSRTAAILLPTTAYILRYCTYNTHETRLDLANNLRVSPGCRSLGPEPCLMPG